ncbi:amidohydrolase [Aurantiacibacter flavus]|uniref:Amidohydrolase family protein n=1 Tax=Aurantiacibacter flavus TaxID=3145232 RepID=A0ABV0CVP4_9SPHN
MPAQAQLGGGSIEAPSADMILINGEIRMDDAWVEAMALRDGVILKMGDEATVRVAAAPGARVIDLAGRTVLPGLHDMHVHPLSGGMASMQCEVHPDSTIDQALESVSGCVAEKSPGEWITGRAYEPAALGVTPTKEMLDRVAPENPVLLTDVSIHSSWANSLALEMAGIDRDTPDPEGGIIERDANGDPTGVLRESASQLVARLVPPATREQSAQALGAALDYILGFGITSMEDALVSGSVAQAYADLADSRHMLPYVRGCMIGGDQELIAMRQVYARDRFSPSCVKLITDGVPTDSHTAAMLESYADTHAGHSERSDRGMLFVETESLEQQMIRYDAMGLTVKLHAAGDAAVRQSLDAIAAAREANGLTGILHDVSHNSFVAPEDLVRAAKIDAVLEFSPYIWFDSPIVDGITKAVGPERVERFTPVREALDAGVFAVAGSDWNVVPSVNPWLALETLVTRRPPGVTDGPQVGGREAITIEEAFDMFTINAARHMYRSDKVGTLEPGKIADLIIIDRNIFEVPIETVHSTKVLATMLAGEFVMGDPNLNGGE